jgi:hypothetical protein
MGLGVRENGICGNLANHGNAYNDSNKAINIKAAYIRVPGKWNFWKSPKPERYSCE